VGDEEEPVIYFANDRFSFMIKVKMSGEELAKKKTNP
jgi:hypothetical protein